MKNILFALLVFLSFNSRAQYYYNDIVGTKEINRQMQTYQALKVRSASAYGTDQRGVKNTDFSEFHEVREGGKALKISTTITLQRTVIYSRFDDQGRVTSTTDSSSDLKSTTNYSYDATGNIVTVQNIVKDTANNFNETETHQWTYTVSGKPEKMLRILQQSGDVNSIDTLVIKFVADENGNAGEERTFRKNVETGYLYYYYDEKNRLSDIVRYNAKLQKLLPDMMFEYDDNDRVIQKITTTPSRSMGHLTWRYIFDDRGLKTKEALFDKDKQLTGRIDYKYTHFQ